MKLCAIAAGTAVSLFALFMAGAGVHTEGISFPRLEKGETIEENWFQTYREGVKVSHTHEKVTDARYKGSRCLLVECTTSYGTSGEKPEKAITASARMLVSYEDLSPLFIESACTSPNYKTIVVAKFTREESGTTVAVSINVNDEKYDHETVLEGKEPYYDEGLLDRVYAREHLKNKKSVTFNTFDVHMEMTDVVSYEFKEEEVIEENGTEEERFIITTEETEIWYDSAGHIVREHTHDGLTLTVPTDKKTALKYPDKLKDYKPPRAVQGDMIVLEKMGVKMKRPSSRYFLSLEEEDEIVLLETLGEEGFLMVVFLPGLYDASHPADVVERLVQLLAAVIGPIEVEFEKGKQDEQHKHKPYTATCRITVNIQKAKGRFWLFKEEGRGVFVLSAALVKDFPRMEKEVMAAMKSVELVKPKYEYEPEKIVDKATGLSVTVPGPGWSVETENLEEGEIFNLYYSWLEGYAGAEVLPQDKDTTPQDIFDGYDADPAMTVKKKFSTRISGHPAAVVYGIVTYKPEEGGKAIRYIATYVHILRGEKSIFFAMCAREEHSELFEKDFDKILESLKIVEKESKEVD